MPESPKKLTTNLVKCEGSRTSKILFVGEAPGEEEDRWTRPFVGSAGKFFDKCLRAAGISRSEVLIGNCFIQRPPRNWVGYFFKDKKQDMLTWEGQEHIDELRDLLLNLKSEGNINLIVALGATSMKILTGKKRINKWRGSVLPCTLVSDFKVYPTYHPSGVMRLMNEPEERLNPLKKQDQQNILPLFLRDLDRIQTQAQTPDYERPQRKFEIVTSVQQGLEKLEELKSSNYVALDIETLKGENERFVWCIGFSSSPDSAFCIPIIEKGIFRWNLSEEAQLWRKVSEVLLDPDIKKIGQNISYDLSILGRYYGLRCAENTVEDTMLAHHTAYPFLRKSLELLASIYTWEPYYKDDGKVWDGKRISDEQEFIYNCRDCAVTREILPLIKRDISELGVQKGYEMTLSIFPSILRMQLRGVKINLEKKETLSEEFKKSKKEAHETIQTLGEGNYNPDSSDQMAKLVYSPAGLNLPVQYNHKTKRPTLDKDARNRLLKKYNNPDSKAYKILKAHSDYKKFSKLVSTYANMEVDPDGRIHTSYGWISTFRLNSSESNFGGGGNLQNIPVRTEEGRKIRELFIPDEGMIFLASDLEQAEDRMVVWAAGDLKAIEQYESGVDRHWEVAKEVFNFDLNTPYHKDEEIQDKITNESHPMKFYRDIAKTIRHATNYMMGPRMLQTILIAQEVYLEESTCKRIMFQAKTNNPLISQWQTMTIERVKATRTLETPLGDRRQFRGRLNQNLFRSAVAFVPQSTVGRLLQLAIRDITRNCSTFECLLNVHDEVVGQCKPENLEQNKKELKKYLEIPIQIEGRELTIPCSFKTGPNWADLKEVK